MTNIFGDLQVSLTHLCIDIYPSNCAFSLHMITFKKSIRFNNFVQSTYIEAGRLFSLLVKNIFQTAEISFSLKNPPTGKQHYEALKTILLGQFIKNCILLSQFSSYNYYNVSSIEWLNRQSLLIVLKEYKVWNKIKTNKEYPYLIKTTTK